MKVMFSLALDYWIGCPFVNWVTQKVTDEYL